LIVALFEIGLMLAPLFKSNHWVFPPIHSLRINAHSPSLFSPFQHQMEPAIAATPSRVFAVNMGTDRRSHTITVPPPYCPCGMMPSNVAYSTGWSSTSTARCFSPFSQGSLSHRHDLESHPSLTGNRNGAGWLVFLNHERHAPFTSLRQRLAARLGRPPRSFASSCIG